MTEFRNASLAELGLILDWAAQEGWNPGLDDAAAFFAADPDGFFVAVDQDDVPVAAISVVNHTPDFAFLGLYIVRPAYRGQGIGLGLWQHAMQHAGRRTVGLDGVEAQQHNYVASGFAHAGGTTRFTGAVSGQSDPDIHKAAAADIPKVIEKEAAASGVEKPEYLKAWFGPVPTRTTLVCRRGERLSGACTVRACQTGAKIGPLIADDGDVANRLISHAATLFAGPLTLDVPERSTGLVKLCQRLGFEPGFKTARMYRGPHLAPEHAYFSVCTLELG